MKTNSKKTGILTPEQVNGKNGVQLAYVINCIKDSARAEDDAQTFATDRDALLWFFGCFNEEFNHEYNKRRTPSLQGRIADYLRGLPSCCCVEYWNDEIQKIGRSWGFCQTERKAAQFVDNWFNVIALRILQAADKVGANYANLF